MREPLTRCYGCLKPSRTEVCSTCKWVGLALSLALLFLVVYVAYGIALALMALSDLLRWVLS